ncbi:MAG: DUF2127 domain-containing protein [Desulfuromonadaceae bacterium]|nr:DUF2127 domain-containing protein [Desulfuromonadaceae bacterium]
MSRSRSHKHFTRNSHARGLHIVALFEGAKGLLVLVAGFGLLSFIHKDIHEAAIRLVEHFHLNPASHYPRIFLDLSERMHDTQLWGIAVAAALYSVVRMVEAVGLWLKKSWAEWFAVLTGGMYIPIEIFEVASSATWPRVAVLVVNLGVVLYLLLVLVRNGEKGSM